MAILNENLDVIDAAAGLAPGDSLHAGRRFRAPVVAASQASHDALLNEPVEGLSVADRLRVAVQVCTVAGVASLAKHYDERLAADATGRAAPPSSALSAMLAFATKLTTDPRLGDRGALDALKRAGLDDPAIVALAQLVAFLSYQLRVVAGLQAIRTTSLDPHEGTR